MKMRRITTRRRTIVFSAAIICLAVFYLPLFHSLLAITSRDGHISTDTRGGRLAVFDDVWETIDERYYDPTLKGIDWSGRRNSFRRAAADARGSRELYEVLRRMIGSLNDPHTRVYSPDEKSDWWNPRFVSIGLAIRELEGVPTVVQVEPKSAPARAGIQPGDEIESVDEIPASELVRQRLAERDSLENESGRARGVAVAMLLEGEVGSFARLRWKGKDGRVKSARFERYWSQRQLGFQISHREGKYLVVGLETFTQALAYEVVRGLRNKLRGAQGVILDLRSNGGGDANAMAAIAAVFLGEGVDLGGFTDRVGTTFYLMTHAKSVFAAKPVAEKQLPLIVLISERTSSAAEILASALQAKGRASIVGTRSCGCVLAIRSRHTLPDEGVLDVSEFDYRTADGVRLEGRGVQPEDLIAPQRLDLYQKRDRALETAFQMLQGKSRAVTKVSAVRVRSSALVKLPER